MPVKILYVTATSSEAVALKKISGIAATQNVYLFGNCEIYLLITGIGSMATNWALEQWFRENGKPDIAINAGIAGSYNDELAIGDVVMPFSDCFADAGIEDGDNFLTLSEAGLMSADEFPYKNGFIYANRAFSEKMKDILKPVRAITVNTATGTQASREKLFKKFNPDIETMEGATFFYICCKENIPFIALRAISNKVEPRNRKNWNIALALNNLSEKLIEVILRLS
jgi:futalosine hydrolase